jgi:hypothetical protein
MIYGKNPKVFKNFSITAIAKYAALKENIRAIKVT